MGGVAAAGLERRVELAGAGLDELRAERGGLAVDVMQVACWVPGPVGAVAPLAVCSGCEHTVLQAGRLRCANPLVGSAAGQALGWPTLEAAWLAGAVGRGAEEMLAELEEALPGWLAVDQGAVVPEPAALDAAFTTAAAGLLAVADLCDGFLAGLVVPEPASARGLALAAGVVNLRSRLASSRTAAEEVGVR